MTEKQKHTSEDLERVQITYNKIINKYRLALADSIHCGSGVIPESARGLLSELDLEMSRTRRQLFNKQPPENELEFKSTNISVM